MLTFESHWLIRDVENKVKIFADKPIKNENGEWVYNDNGEIFRGMHLRGYDDKYDYVTKENSPVEIHFITPFKLMYLFDLC